MPSKFSENTKKDVESSLDTIIPKFSVSSSVIKSNPLTTNFSQSNQALDSSSWDNFIEKRK